MEGGNVEKVKIFSVEEGRCPYCGSFDIMGDLPDFTDGMVYYRTLCRECGRWFEEWYDLNFVGHNVGKDFLIDIYPGDEGKVIEMEV